MNNLPNEAHSPGDRTGCFEAVYAGLFGYSYIVLWVAFGKWVKLLYHAAAEQVKPFPVTSDLQGEALWFDILIAGSILLAIFQVGRTYYYTHLFDEQHDNPTHFITRLASTPRFLDRLIRLGVASLIVVAIEIYARPGLVQYHEHRQKTGQCDYKLLLPIALTLLVIFLLLFLWDINLCFWRKCRLPALTDKETFLQSLTLYDPPLKMIQRLTGIIYCSILCGLLYFGPNVPALVFFGMFLGFFGALWGLDYLKNTSRVWWRDAARSLPDGCVGPQRFINENLSWSLTLLRLFWPGLTMSKIKTQVQKRMKTKFIIFIIAAFLIGSFVVFISRPHKPSSTVSIAIGKNVWCSLPIVAKERGYFKEEGLDVSFIYQDAGRYCMDALLSRSVEFAAVVEANVAYVGFTGNKTPVVLAEIVSSSCGIISRKSAGINSEADLRGKRIAYTPATGAEPFLYRFLMKHRISNGDVELRKMQPKALQPALVAKEVDAAATWEPFIYNCTKAMNGDTTEFRDPDAFTGYMMIATNRQWASNKRDIVNAMLRSLRKAEVYVRDNPADSQAMLARYLGMDIEAVRKIWPYFKIGLRLNKAELLQAIGYVAENARVIDPQFTGKEMPDYNGYIDESFLATNEN